MNSKNNAVVFLSWLAVFLWMGFIFILSAQTGDDSGAISGGFIEFVGAFVRVFAPNISEEALHLIVRKGAHMFEYAVLAILFANALRQHFYERRVVYQLALTASLLYAISDELHQTLVPGRSGQYIDVAIDFVGAIIGILLFKLCATIIARRNYNQ